MHLQTNFGHEFSETKAQLLYKISDFRKAKYLFKRMEIDWTEVDYENILKKQINRKREKCEVIVSNEKPLELKFDNKNEVLTLWLLEHGQFRSRIFLYLAITIIIVKSII